MRDSKLKVRSNGRTSVYEHFSSVNGGGVRLPGTVPPNWFSTSDDFLNPPSVGIYFPEPGDYQIQFVLRDWGGEKIIESKVVDITIEKPSGVNKKAFDFMKDIRFLRTVPGSLT